MKVPTSRSLTAGLLVVSVLSALGVVLHENRDQRGRAEHRVEFQRLVGGLGFGASVDISHCCFCFDPRLRGVCSYWEGPIPGGFFLCAEHLGRVTSYPYLHTSRVTESDTTEHAASD